MPTPPTVRPVGTDGRPSARGTRPCRRRRLLAPLLTVLMLTAAGCARHSARVAEGPAGPDAPVADEEAGGGTPAQDPVRRWPGQSPAAAIGGPLPTDKIGTEEMTVFLAETVCEPEVTDVAGFATLVCNHATGNVRVVAYRFSDPGLTWVQGTGFAEDYITTDIPDWCTYGMLVDEWIIFLFHRESREATEVVSAFQSRFWDAVPLVVGCLFDPVEGGTTVVDFERTWGTSGWCNPDYRGNVQYRKGFANAHPDAEALPAAGFVCRRNGADVSASMYSNSADAALAVERLRQDSAAGTCRWVGVVDRWVFEEDTRSSSGDGADFVSGLDQVRATVAVGCP
ncbi:MAG: hypothetical protein ACK5RL_09725 [Acidimicrobiales bacterium]